MPPVSGASQTISICALPGRARRAPSLSTRRYWYLAMVVSVEAVQERPICPVPGVMVKPAGAAGVMRTVASLESALWTSKLFARILKVYAAPGSIFDTVRDVESSSAVLFFQGR